MFGRVRLLQYIVRSGGVCAACVLMCHASAQELQQPTGNCAPQQVRILLASDGDPADYFGISADVDGTTAIIGARQDDEAALNAGAAYIFRNDGDGAWTQIAKLTASDAGENDNLGHTVGLSGDIAIVGAHRDDDGGDDAGAAYIFRDDGAGNWVEVEKLFADDAAPGDRFGWAVDVHNDTAIVGAFMHDVENNITDAGAAYIFKHDGRGNWFQTTKLTAADAQPGDQFGWFVAIHGDRAIIAARYDDDQGINAGAAYIFHNERGSWVEVQKLTASDGETNDQFARAVAIHEAVAVVGAPLKDEGGTDAGAAYVFRETQRGTWIETAKLTAADGAAGDDFGTAVAVDVSTVLIGARWHDGAGENAGNVYIFRELDGVWTETNAFTADDAAPGDQVGFSVALDGDTAVIGARYDDDNGENAGSAFVFDLNCPGVCIADLDGDNTIGISDLLELLSAWGECPQCPADLNGDGIVDVADLLEMLSAWGPCPPT